MKPAECHHLIQQLLDGEITAEDFARLDEELKRNPDALVAYRLFTGIHVGLERKGKIDAAIRTAPVVPIDRLMKLQRRSVARTSMLAAAAVILLSALVMWRIMAPDVTAGQEATFRSTPGSSFTFSHAPDETAPTAGTLPQGLTVRLDHGAIELSLPHQVRAILQAPATLTLVDDRTVALDRGRAFFEVRSPAGHGFTVETPHQKIVDLGTAFGIDLPVGTGETKLHVFEGSVRIDALDTTVGSGEVFQAPTAVSLLETRVLRQLDKSGDPFMRRIPDKLDNIFVEDFESGLLAEKDYAIHMDPAVILDHAGNRFAGFTKDKPWRFSTSKELQIRNPGFEEAKVEAGLPVPHWKEVTGAKLGFNTYVQQPKPTEGSLLLHVSQERTLVQDLDVPIREGFTYILTLDVGNDPIQPESQAIVRFFGSDNGFETPLAEILVQPPEESWSRSQTLRFTASSQEATGQTLGIALSSKNGRSTFDDLRICEIQAFNQSKPADTPSFESDRNGQADTRPPLVASIHPAPDTSKAAPDGMPTLVFDEPVRFGKGRIFVKNLSDGSETELVVGSNRTSLNGRILTFLPRLGLGDGTKQIGGIPGWSSSGPVSRFNPSGKEYRYQHPDLSDDSKTRGTLGSMEGPSLATLGNEGHPGTLRHSLGKVEQGLTYTVSVGIGCRDSANPTSFAGYRIRLLRDSIVLAEVTDRKPPGPPNSVTPVGFSWSSNHHTAESTANSPLVLEISTLEPLDGKTGYLDIDHVKVTSLGDVGQ